MGGDQDCLRFDAPELDSRPLERPSKRARSSLRSESAPATESLLARAMQPATPYGRLHSLHWLKTSGFWTVPLRDTEGEWWELVTR